MRTEPLQDGQVGRSVSRVESAAKVSGAAEYIYNLEIPHMLHAGIARSQVPHGRIAAIHTEAARRMPGVETVVTGSGIASLIPDPYYGPAFHDQPILALDVVRYVGEAVAVVLAATHETAREAKDLVAVDYEPLPAVFDESEAAKPEAPLVHEQLRPSAAFEDLRHLSGRSGTNISMEYRLRRGDVGAAFEESDRLFEDTFRTQQVMHAPLEPHVAVAELDGSGRLIVHSSTQSPSFVRAELARLLGWPEHRVRVRTAFVGGGFGAKLYMKVEALAAACALLTGRPVRIALSMDEQFYVITRHATTFAIKTGVTSDGRIRARECSIWWNGGAYADIGPRVTQKAGFVASGPYDIANVSIDSRAVYTNLPPAGAMRGFGVPQVNWAYESQMDIMAHRLGIDPVEFRRRNALKSGQPQATGTIPSDANTETVLDEVARLIRWSEPRDRGGEGQPRRRGRGIAIGIKAVVTPTTSAAAVKLDADGSVTVFAGTVDIGQGSDTVLAQIAGEILGTAAESIRIAHPDTDLTPYDMGTLGSRSTFHMGSAVATATCDVRAQLLAKAARTLNAPVGDLDLSDGHVIVRQGEQKVSVEEIMARAFGRGAGTLVGSGSFTPSYEPPDADTGQSRDIAVFWMVGGAGVDLEVDTETGKIRVRRLAVVGDVGRAINPELVRAQLSGAALQQLGMTLSEELRFEDGQLTNPGLAFYKVPIFPDLPDEIEVGFVESPHPKGPFGAKGVGETGTLAVAAAVGNALFDAVGVRVRELPLTPERVLRALKAAAGSALE